MRHPHFSNSFNIRMSPLFEAKRKTAPGSPTSDEVFDQAATAAAIFRFLRHASGVNNLADRWRPFEQKRDVEI
jgi:hypothetical protein